MDIVLLIGRLLFVGIFVASGFNHFSQGARDYAKLKGAPNPETLVPLGGAVIIAGGISVGIGLWADLGALLLIGFSVSVAMVMHAFWKESDPQTQQNEMAHFMKNMSMAGAGIVIFWLYNQSQDVPASVTDALFGRI
jgi:uncharacterized membrane protein YphA (DoxX/SURF4 family)